MEIKPWERNILHELLLEQGITYYKLADLAYEGRNLPENSLGEEVEAISGIVVTPSTVYHFWLNWIDNRYTLGGDSWYEIDIEEFIDEPEQQQIFELQSLLRQQEGLVTDYRRYWPPQLLNLVQEILKKSFSNNWGYNIFPNSEIFYRLKRSLISSEEITLQIINEEVDQQGIIFTLKIKGSVRSLKNLSEIIVDILIKQHELLFFFIPFRTEAKIQYWFTIGKPGHGHIGAFIFDLKEIENFNEINDLDYLPFYEPNE